MSNPSGKDAARELLPERGRDDSHPERVGKETGGQGRRLVSLFGREDEAERRAGGASPLQILRATVEGAADALLVVDEQLNVLEFNARFVELWQIPDELITSGSDRAMLAFVVARALDPNGLRLEIEGGGGAGSTRDGSTVALRDGRTVECLVSTITGHAELPAGRVLSFRDVTEHHINARRLQEMADRDPHTGLLNRRRFDHELAEEVDRAQRLGRSAAVIVVDLDGVKQINDTLGHRAGDALIASIADLLLELVRESDVLARIGGDEFGLLLPGTDVDEAAEIALDLVNAVRGHRTVVEGKPIRATASAGVAAVPAGGEYDADSVVDRADAAMYDSKEGGRDRVGVDRAVAGYRPRMDSHLTWSGRIREALERDRFTLYAQPIIDLGHRNIYAHEVLLRMLGPEGEVLGPNAFLPAAERSGLIGEIDGWVVRKTIAELAERQLAGDDVTLSVNLSGRSIGDPSLLQLVADELERTGADPRGLVFEITETAAVTSLDQAREFAEELARMGCRLALDDFGAGFGSFYYVKHLPLDFLKIDGDFVEYLGRNPTDQAVVRAIVGLSESLRKSTIAEFVTDERTLRALRRYGVDFGQGFHIGIPRPMTGSWWLDAPMPKRYERLKI